MTAQLLAPRFLPRESCPHTLQLKIVNQRLLLTLGQPHSLDRRTSRCCIWRINKFGFFAFQSSHCGCVVHDIEASCEAKSGGAGATTNNRGGRKEPAECELHLIVIIAVPASRSDLATSSQSLPSYRHHVTRGYHDHVCHPAVDERFPSLTSFAVSTTAKAVVMEITRELLVISLYDTN